MFGKYRPISDLYNVPKPIQPIPANNPHLSQLKRDNMYASGTCDVTVSCDDKANTDNAKPVMNIKMTEYTNTADPKVWGPSFWFSLHNGAARYPLNASNLIMERMKGFIH
jgi:hypothetical protein